MNRFIDLLLRHPDIQKAEIKSRNELASLCFEIFLDRFRQLEGKRIDVKTGKVNVTIKEPLGKKMDKAAGHPIPDSGLWLPKKTDILGQILRSLFIRYVPEFKEYSRLFEITVDDLKEAAEGVKN
jgi:hypothetical protein